MTPELATIEFGGLSLDLLPSGAAWHRQRNVLFVADLHLGKAASYRQLGQPVPQGTTTKTLASLSNDIECCNARHLIVLGDFLHGPLVHRSHSTLEAIAAWRAHHGSLAITLIRGNHDDRAGDPPLALDIEVADEPFMFESLACCHDENSWPGTSNTGAVMAGHVHPVAVIRGGARERLRLACFVVGKTRLLLPAYGAFTGGHVIKPAAGESIYVIADQSVFRLPGSS